MMLHHTADTKKRRRRNSVAPSSSCSSSSPSWRSAGAQSQCFCSPGPGPGPGRLLATSSLSNCCPGASSASRPAPAVHLNTLLVALALLLLLLLTSSSCNDLDRIGVAAAAVPPRKMARIQRHLDRINRPAARSIQSADGDTIDCVAPHKQHALDHPLLKTHTIQAEPPQVPRGGRQASYLTAAAAATATKANGSSRGREAWQTWHHGGHCPRGTVAFRRTSAEDVLRARSISRFGCKKKRKHVDGARAASAHLPLYLPAESNQPGSSPLDHLLARTTLRIRLMPRRIEARGSTRSPAGRNPQERKEAARAETLPLTMAAAGGDVEEGSGVGVAGIGTGSEEGQYYETF